jgi:hypothetical protein
MDVVQLISAIATFASVVVVAVSLVVLTRQLREMSKQTESLTGSLRTSAVAAMSGMYFPVLQGYLDYPKLRLLFFEDEGMARVEPASLTEDERSRALTLAELILNAMEMTVLSDRAGGQLAGVSGLWANNTQDILAKSEFLRGHLERRSRWYDPELVDLGRSAATASSAATPPSP